MCVCACRECKENGHKTTGVKPCAQQLRGGMFSCASPGDTATLPVCLSPPAVRFPTHDRCGCSPLPPQHWLLRLTDPRGCCKVGVVWRHTAVVPKQGASKGQTEARQTRAAANEEVRRVRIVQHGMRSWLHALPRSKNQGRAEQGAKKRSQDKVAKGPQLLPRRQAGRVWKSRA